MNAHRHAAGLLTILFGDNPKDASAHSLLFLRFSAHLCFFELWRTPLFFELWRTAIQKPLERWACLILFLCRLESELARFDFYDSIALHRPESTSARQSLELILARQSLELTLACRPPTCPERPNLVRNQCEREKPMFFPSRALPFPSPPLRRAVFARFYFWRLRVSSDSGRDKRPPSP